MYSKCVIEERVVSSEKRVTGKAGEREGRRGRGGGGVVCLD